MNLEEIRKFFKEKSEKKNIDGWKITAPTAGKICGNREIKIIFCLFPQSLC